jgi:hypothetical protein
VAGIQGNAVVRVLPALGQYYPCLESLEIKAEVFGNGNGVAHLLEHDHVRPEGEHHHGLVLFAQLPQVYPYVHEPRRDFNL